MGSTSWARASRACQMAHGRRNYVLPQNAEVEVPRTGKKAVIYAASVAVAVVLTVALVYSYPMLSSSESSVADSSMLGKNDVWKIVSPKKKKGAIKYGDTVALVGQNNRYLTARYSAKVTCRAAKVSTLATWTLVGGTGAVVYGHQLVFKSEFGFLTGNPAGMRADAKQATQIEHYFVGKPGKEDGMAAKPGPHYGMKVTLTNDKEETLQSDKNG